MLPCLIRRLNAAGPNGHCAEQRIGYYSGSRKC
jgi:hypothetical protein